MPKCAAKSFTGGPVAPYDPPKALFALPTTHTMAAADFPRFRLAQKYPGSPRGDVRQ